jgi:glutamate synthase domain-containing protein 3
MKSKKFDAAEKHFKEKELKFQQRNNKLLNQIKELKEIVMQLSSLNSQLVKENETLKNENNSINMKYQKVLEYSNLSEDDIKKALERDRVMNNFSGLMGFGGLFKYI